MPWCLHNWTFGVQCEPWMGSRMVQGCIYGVLSNYILVSWCTTLTVWSFNLLSLDRAFFYALVFMSVSLSVTALVGFTALVTLVGFWQLF